MSRRLKMAIIGCGKVAHLHAKAINEIDECVLVAVQSRNPQRAKDFASKYEVKAYEQVAEMIRAEKIDAVIICTPHPEHKQPAIAAMEAGAHALVEKPLAISLDDCDLMIKTASQHKKVLGVISQRRFLQSAIRIKKAIDDGKIGVPALATVLMLGWRNEAYYNSDSWRGAWDTEGGGVLVNQAPHQLDLLQWFMNDEMEELYGVCKNINHPYIEVEDTAVAIVKFKKGGIANILVSNSQRPGIYARVHIHGSNGSSVGVQTDGGAMFIAGVPSIVEPPKNDIWTIPGEENMLSKWEDEDACFFKEIDPIGYYLKLQIRDFVLAILEEREPLVTGIEGRKTVALFNAIYASNRSNGVIKL